MRFDPELVREEAAPEEPGKGTVAASRSAWSPGRPPRASPLPDRDTRSTKLGSSGTSYELLIQRVRDQARASLPPGARVLVVSKGDYRLLDLGGCEAEHFPQTADGVYGGYHPRDSAAAIAHLEALRRGGAEFLLIPQTALWWLEHYQGFRRHLEAHYRRVVDNEESCFVYALRGAPEATFSRSGLLALGEGR